MKDPQPINLTIDTKLLRAQIDELEKKVIEVREARTILAGVAKIGELIPRGWQFTFNRSEFADSEYSLVCRCLEAPTGLDDPTLRHCSMRGATIAECFKRFLEGFK